MNAIVYTIFVSVSLYVSCLAAGDAPGSQLYVQIYSEQYFNGYTLQVNLTSGCNSVAHFMRWYGTIGSINTKGNCVNVYGKEDCSCNFISLKPGNPFHDVLGRWNDMDRRARAIGLCHDVCHETKIENTEEPVSVEVFRTKEFEGTNQTLTVHQGTCSQLSQEMQGVIMSLKVNPKACIELHQFADCSGGYRDFPKGSVSLNNLKHWDWYEKLRVESISLCGYRCNQTHNETETTFSSTTMTEEITHPVVAITETPTHSTTEMEQTSMKEESQIIESNQISTNGDSTSGNYIWTLLIVSLSAVATVLFIVGVTQFIKHRFGSSGYRVMFQNTS